MFSLNFDIKKIEFSDFIENIQILKYELDRNFKSKAASIPQAEVSYLSEISDALTKGDNSLSLLEKIELSRQARNLSQVFRTRYLDFIPEELVIAIETSEKIAEAKEGILLGLSNIQASREQNNIELSYQGVLQILATIEQKKIYISLRVHENIKESFNNFSIELEKIKLNEANEEINANNRISYIRAISIASKAILWEISEYERSLDSQEIDTIKENLDSSKYNKNKESIDWQEEEKFIDDLIAMREEWDKEEYTQEEEEAFDLVMTRLNQE